MRFRFLIHLLFIVAIGITGCRDYNENLADSLLEPNPVDSFQIEKLISSQQEVTSLNLLNDSTLIGFDHFNQLNIYIKNGSTFRFKRSEFMPPERTNPGFLSVAENGFLLFSDKKVYRYNPDYRLQDSSKFTAVIKYLKGDYFPACSNFLPLLHFGDTLLSYYANNNPNDFLTNFKEDSFMEFTLRETIDSIKTYSPKPKDLEYYDVNFFSFHTAINNSIYKLYNGIDTLYCHNRHSHKDEKIPIRNKDYVLPERSVLKNAFDFQYLTKREISSFSYCGMFHNSVNDHIVLFYNSPVDQKDKKNPTPKDQKLKAVVLDKNLSIINYFVFEKEFMPTMTFFQYANKGLAMPLNNEDPTNEKTRFYIYNF